MKIVLQHLTKKFPARGPVRGRKNREDVIAVNDFDFEIPDGTWPRARRLPRSSSTPAARASRSVSARRRTSIRDAILHQNITKKDASRRPFSYKMEDWMKRSYCLLQGLR